MEKVCILIVIWAMLSNAHVGVPMQSTFTILSFEETGNSCSKSCSAPLVSSNSSYTCSSNIEYWGNGVKLFSDPLPPPSSYQSYLLVQATVKLYGIFNCGGATKGATINVTLDGTLLEEVEGPSKPSDCSCMGCITELTLNSKYYDQGMPQYKYSGINTFQIDVASDNSICITYANLTLQYLEVSPFIIWISPSSGPTTGFTNVSLWAGPGYYDFLDYCCVFGQPPCIPAQYVSEAQIICPSPEHGTTGSENLYLRITQNSQTLDTSQQFTYYLPPTVTALSPSSAEVGQNITIIGTNFVDLNSNRLLFGNQIIHLSFNNETALVVTVPPGSGVVPVSFSENGQQYTESLFFTYLVPPQPPSPTKPSLIPGWAWVVIVFGGSTVIIVAIVYIANRLKSKKRNTDVYSENASLLSATDSMMFTKQIDIHSVQILHRIGKGTFGEVYKGRWSGTDVAVKFLQPPGVVNDSFLQEFNKEVMIMRVCRHPNVLQFLGASASPPNICIVMEYMPLGSLYRILHDENMTVELETLRKMMIDAARGMNYLHKSNPIIIHRDLKSHNLLVDENWKVKVCDFGLSKIMEGTNEAKNMTACGTPSWTAPEILRNEPYTEKADIYSFGIVMWECVTRTDPYEGMAPFQVVLSVGTKGMRPTIPSNCPMGWSQLMESCWDETSENRPSFDDVLSRLDIMQLQSLY